MSDEHKTDHRVDLDAAEQYQRLFVKPMIDSLKAELETQLKPVLIMQQNQEQRVNALDGRIVKLESSNKKALIGWGVYATLAAGVWAWAWNRLKAHFS
jgi:hypothetical protein